VWEDLLKKRVPIGALPSVTNGTMLSFYLSAHIRCTDRPFFWMSSVVCRVVRRNSTGVLEVYIASVFRVEK
jgi:hypothetical protein